MGQKGDIIEVEASYFREMQELWNRLIAMMPSTRRLDDVSRITVPPDVKIVLEQCNDAAGILEKIWSKQMEYLNSKYSELGL